MNDEFVITIGGPHGSGRTTIARAISKRFGMKHFSTGKVFREVAAERGLSVLELNESAEKEVDLEVDRRSKEEGAKGGVVIESDLAAWVNKDLQDKTVIKIWITASAETRGSRVFNDEKKRLNEKYATVEDAVKSVDKRDKADATRYLDYYGIDLCDMSIYDLVMDTENMTIEEVINKVSSYIEERGCIKCTKLEEHASKPADERVAGTA